MKVTAVSVRPTEASVAAGRPALTPELLAASGARYSRSNEGLDAILCKIDPNNLDKSVESIFRMIDYGHQSIADMVPVSMFIDGISIWLAYYVWSLVPTAGGQESSTRYIRLTLDGLVPPESLGIPENAVAGWTNLMGRAFAAYGEALSLWEQIADAMPDVARIPPSVMADTSDLGQRKLARMKRNYGFDRARYFLPVAARTNMMLIMSARGWVQLCQNLLSHPLAEAKALGTTLRHELELMAPRMMKHAEAKTSLVRGLQFEFERDRARARAGVPSFLAPSASSSCKSPSPSLEVLLPSTLGEGFAANLQFHDNRYAWVGPDLRRTAVRFGWDAVALAEIRDLNRHRTGTKHCPPIPLGFYCADDQVPAPDTAVECGSTLNRLSRIGAEASRTAHEKLCDSDHTHVYWTLLGTQYAFEHLTTADKFIYEAELRTGTGAHFRYAKHLHDVLELWYKEFPETRGMIIEGSAEPE